MNTKTTEPSAHARWLFGDDSGAVAVIAAVMAVVMIGAAALVVDAGSLYAERRKLQTAADAAALAGVQELPADPAKARAVALSYVAANASEASEIQAVVESGLATNDTIRVVVGTPDSPLYFARIWGMESSEVAARAKARVTSPIAYGAGVMPFGIIAKKNENPQTGYGYGFEPPVEIELKTFSKSFKGNFGFIALDEVPGRNWGGNELKDTISAGGTDHPVWSDREYSTKTGNVSPTMTELSAWIGGDAHSFTDVITTVDANGLRHVSVAGEADRCHRLVLCPIIVNGHQPGDARYEWPNGNDDMLVIGFMEFFVTSWGTQGNDCWIKGIPVRTVSTEELIPGAIGSSGQVHYSLVQ